MVTLRADLTPSAKIAFFKGPNGGGLVSEGFGMAGSAGAGAWGCGGGGECGGEGSTEGGLVDSLEPPKEKGRLPTSVGVYGGVE